MKPLHQKPPVFLDRDGTIIVEKEYLGDPSQVCLEEGVIEGLARLQAMGHSLFVVSNQSGVGRGMFTKSDVRRVNAKLDELLRRDGIIILAWYFCPHAPDAVCACRKPLPGMALAASSDWGVQLAGSYVIGDRKIDLELADAIGGTGILVTTGHGLEDVQWAQAGARPIFHCLRQAADYVLKCESEITAPGARDKHRHVTEVR